MVCSPGMAPVYGLCTAQLQGHHSHDGTPELCSAAALS